MPENPPPPENRLRQVILAILLPVLAIALLALVPELRQLDAFWKGAIFVLVFAGSILFIKKKKNPPPPA